MAPRPRFERLDPEKQAAIIKAASDEFAQHGYANASFNRIIESAGLSKGAMYYYFDDKRDLFMTVLHSYQRDILGHFGELPEVETPEDFWQGLHDLFLRIAEVKMAHPDFLQLGMAMFKSLLSGELQMSPHHLFGEALGWAEKLVDSGQRVGAVRADVPAGLLVAMTFGAMEAVDLWLIQQIDSLDDIDMSGAHAFAVGMFRRLLEIRPDIDGATWTILPSGNEGDEQKKGGR